MTKMDKRAEDREALERLLEIYGADRTRWPARERLRFAGVVSEDKAGGPHAGGGRRARPAAGAGAARQRRRRRRVEGAHHGGGVAIAARRSLPSLPRGKPAFGQGSSASRGRRAPFDRQGSRAASGRRRRCWPPRWCSASCSARRARSIRRCRKWREVDRLRRHRQQRQYRQFAACAGRGRRTGSPTRICYDDRDSFRRRHLPQAALGADGVAGAQRADHRRRGGHVVLLAPGHGRTAEGSKGSGAARLCPHACRASAPT